MLGGVFSCELVEESSGFALLRVSGEGASKTFEDEPGGHRWQRVPPTERRGRVHTSTITVAVLSEPTEQQVKIDEDDLTITFMRGSGAGGQHRNVTDSAVRIVHNPTGIVVRCENERSQTANKLTAMAVLRARLVEHAKNQANGERASDRRKQVGSGMRGDKRRTIRTQDDVVNDHVTGKQWRYKSYARGDWD